MSERIVIAGAGIAGLAAAMALAGPGRDILILDRDGALPSGDADDVFLNWTRRGATQLRHSHVFLGRLVRLLRQAHPGLWSALMRAGAREFRFADALPQVLRARYCGVEGDDDFSILFSRRTTLEAVMRGYVAGLEGVRFLPDAFIRDLSVTRTPTGPAAEALVVDVGGVPRTICFDSLVDATGRSGPFAGYLEAAGIGIPEEASPAGILYFTRHYRLLPDAHEPARESAPRAGDLGYIKYGVFPADNGCFSITLACPEIEHGLRIALPGGDAFDRVCALLPGCAPWTDPVRASPVSKVFAMGNLRNSWRRFVTAGGPLLARYYPVGDAAVRTNPLYGRGCTTAFIQAFALGDAFAGSSDPAVRMRTLDAAVWRELRPFFDAMVRQDRAAVRRARHEQDPAYRPRLKARIMRSFVTDAVEPATRADLSVLRALMRPFHMHEHPTAWMKRASVMVRILWIWMLPRSLKRSHYAPRLGPDRASLIAAIASQAGEAGEGGGAVAPRAA